MIAILFALIKKVRKRLRALKRKYKGPDWYLTTQSQTLCDQFAGDKAEFVAFDSSLDDPFMADVWQEAIDAAVNYKDDSTVVAEVQEKSVTVEENMQTARDIYNEMIYFGQKAFGKNSIVLKQFGQGQKYADASHTQGKMYNFLDELHAAAEKHKVKLIAEGCTQAKIDSIATVRDTFSTVNREQNLLISDRPEISQGRVKAYNDLHKITMQVITAAKTVFKNDPARLGQYVYRPPITPKGAKAYTGNLAPGASATVNITVDLDPETPVRFESFVSSMNFYASSTLNAPPGPSDPLLLVEPGTAHVNTAGGIAAMLGLDETENLLNVQNTGGATGTWRVTIG